MIASYKIPKAKSMLLRPTGNLSGIIGRYPIARTAKLNLPIPTRNSKLDVKTSHPNIETRADNRTAYQSLLPVKMQRLRSLSHKWNPNPLEDMATPNCL